MNIILHTRGTGLCNQLFALTSGILDTLSAGVKNVKVSSFLCDIKTRKEMPASQVFDFEAMRESLGIHFTDYTGRKGKCNFKWYTKYEISKFKDVLQCIKFKDVYYNTAEFTPQYVVHLRVEEDGIAHWSKMNKMTKDVFREKLHKQYLEVIQEHVPENSEIFVLCYDRDHPLVEQLRQKYTVRMNDKSDNRENSAIVDLLTGERCTGVFIGCHNMELNRGSTFSYTLWSRGKSIKKSIFIDLDCITSSPVVTI